MDNIVAFLKNPNGHNEDGYNQLYNLFCRIAEKFDIEDTLEEFHNFLLFKLFNNASLTRFLMEVEEKQVIMSFVRKMIINHLFTMFKNKKDDISIFDNLTGDANNDSDLTIGDTIKDSSLAAEIIFEAYELLRLVRDQFSDKKLRILCHYFYSGEYVFIEDMNQNAFYKSVERIKKDLTDICLSNRFSEEAVSYFIQEIYLSEICEKFRINM